MERKKRVLILDDDKGFLEATRLLLEEAGYEVCTAPEVTHSLIALREFHPDVLLLDLFMPYMDGDVYLPWIRTQYPDLAVVLSTGADSVNEEFFRAHGVTRILFKPFGHETLLPALEHAIAASPARQVA